MNDTFELTQEHINQFLARQKPKKGRRVIWNSYIQGTYIKAIHGPIGTPKHSK
jgi:hypothetical protein